MAASDSPGPLAGAVLNGRWRLVRLLGEGGMGAVYEADGVRGEGKRAVKLLHEEFVKVDEVLSRFWAEAQASRALTHPNISQILEAATAENGTPYLVMELLHGIPLANWTERRQPIPADIAIPILLGVLAALKVAHAQGIIHRDLKPDNLFLVPDERGTYQAKVLDFGIAKIMDVAGGMGQKTQTGMLLGTPGYMSPEQIRNAKAVDPRSDLWSLGIILYEMLTAAEPFPAANDFVRMTAVLTDEMQPIERVAPGLAAWAPFFARALAKDLAQRFQSAEEMERALQSMSMSMARGPQTQATAARPAPAIAAYAPAPQPLPASPTLGSPPAAPLAGAAPGAHTHMSAQQPPGTPAYVAHAAPSIDVVAAAPASSKGAPWWLVAVVGVVCLGLGVAIGYFANASPSATDGTTPAARPTPPSAPPGTRR